MSVATISEVSEPQSMTNEEPQNSEITIEAGDAFSVPVLSKKEKHKLEKELKQKEKKEKERKEKERKEKEKLEKEREKQLKKEKKKHPEAKSSESISPTTPSVDKELKLDEATISSSDSPSDAQKSDDLGSPPTTASTATATQEEADDHPHINTEPSGHEQPSPTLVTSPTNIEDEVIDATQNNINDTTSTDETNQHTESAESSDPKKNWSTAFGQVRGFLARFPTVVVEKINQKLDEMDEQYLEQLSDEEFIQNLTIDDQDPAITSNDEVPPPPISKDPPPPISKDLETEQQQREELLGENKPPAVPPKDTNFKRAKKESLSAQEALADAANALAERGEKLGQLGEKLEGVNNASSEFARLARELAQREANKKWYNIF